MDLPRFHVPPPQQHYPQRVEDLAEWLDTGRYRAQLPRVLREGDHDVLPRDQVFALIETGNCAGLNLGEWLLAVDYKQQWDELHPERAEPLARAMWQAALHLPLPCELLLTRLALCLAADGEPPAPSLVASFDTFAAGASAGLAEVCESLAILIEHHQMGSELTFDILKGQLLEQLGLENR